MTPTAHLSEDDHPTRTLCGEEWEDWQAPQLSAVELDLDNSPYSVRLAVRESDDARALPKGTRIRQCPACRKAAFKS